MILFNKNNLHSSVIYSCTRPRTIKISYHPIKYSRNYCNCNFDDDDDDDDEIYKELFFTWAIVLCAWWCIIFRDK